MLERLKARVARANTDLPAANPLQDEERATARFVIDGRRDDAPVADISRGPGTDAAGARIENRLLPD